MRKPTTKKSLKPALAPANTVPDNAVTPEFEIVRDTEAHVTKRGRPLFLTARRFINICHLIEQGEAAYEACNKNLVSYSRFRRHVQRLPSYQRRLKEAEEIREKFLFEFHVANVKKHAPKTVIASLWWLERRYPDRFALRSVHRPEGQDEKLVGDKISEEDLKRYSEQMAEFQKKNERSKTELENPASEQQ